MGLNLNFKSSANLKPKFEVNSKDECELDRDIVRHGWGHLDMRVEDNEKKIEAIRDWVRKKYDDSYQIDIHPSKRNITIYNQQRMELTSVLNTINDSIERDVYKNKYCKCHFSRNLNAKEQQWAVEFYQHAYPNAYNISFHNPRCLILELRPQFENFDRNVKNVVQNIWKHGEIFVTNGLDYDSIDHERFTSHIKQTLGTHIHVSWDNIRKGHVLSDFARLRFLEQHATKLAEIRAGINRNNFAKIRLDRELDNQQITYIREHLQSVHGMKYNLYHDGSRKNLCIVPFDIHKIQDLKSSLWTMFARSGGLQMALYNSTVITHKEKLGTDLSSCAELWRVLNAIDENINRIIAEKQNKIRELEAAIEEKKKALEELRSTLPYDENLREENIEAELNKYIQNTLQKEDCVRDYYDNGIRKFQLEEHYYVDLIKKYNKQRLIEYNKNLFTHDSILEVKDHLFLEYIFNDTHDFFRIRGHNPNNIEVSAFSYIEFNHDSKAIMTGKYYREIDSYCKKLKFGVQSEGTPFHYKIIPPFIKTEEELEDKIKHDNESLAIAIKQGIFLIRRPDFLKPSDFLKMIFWGLQNEKIEEQLFKIDGSEIITIDKANYNSMTQIDKESVLFGFRFRDDNRIIGLQGILNPINIKCKYFTDSPLIQWLSANPIHLEKNKFDENSLKKLQKYLDDFIVSIHFNDRIIEKLKERETQLIEALKTIPEKFITDSSVEITYILKIELSSLQETLGSIIRYSQTIQSKLVEVHSENSYKVIRIYYLKSDENFIKTRFGYLYETKADIERKYKQDLILAIDNSAYGYISKNNLDFILDKFKRKSSVTLKLFFDRLSNNLENLFVRYVLFESKGGFQPLKIAYTKKTELQVLNYFGKTYDSLEEIFREKVEIVKDRIENSKQGYILADWSSETVNTYHEKLQKQLYNYSTLKAICLKNNLIKMKYIRNDKVKTGFQTIFYTDKTEPMVKSKFTLLDKPSNTSNNRDVILKIKALLSNKDFIRINEDFLKLLPKFAKPNVEDYLANFVDDPGIKTGIVEIKTSGGHQLIRILYLQENQAKIEKKFKMIYNDKNELLLHQSELLVNYLLNLKRGFSLFKNKYFKRLFKRQERTIYNIIDRIVDFDPRIASGNIMLNNKLCKICYLTIKKDFIEKNYGKIM